MLRLPPFELRAPRTLEEACEILSVDPQGSRVVAGGTDLYPNMKRRHQQARVVVSLRRAGGLRGIRGGTGGEISIGAMTPLAEIAADGAIRETHPALARAIRSISTPVLRRMGTIGGNLCLDSRCTYYNQSEEWRRSIDYCMKEAGETCWVAPSSPRCWAISASDSAPILCALDARVRLVSKDGERVLALTELYRDDGIDFLSKRPDEILTEVIIPPADGARASFWKLRRRGSIDFAVLSVAPVIWLEGDGTVRRAEIFLGAVASWPARAVDAMEVLVGKKLSAETIEEAAAVARKAANPLNNTDFVAQWRGQMIGRYLEAALREIAGLPGERLDPKHPLEVAGGL